MLNEVLENLNLIIFLFIMSVSIFFCFWPLLTDLSIVLINLYFLVSIIIKKDFI